MARPKKILSETAKRIVESGTKDIEKFVRENRKLTSKERGEKIREGIAKRKAEKAKADATNEEFLAQAAADAVVDITNNAKPGTEAVAVAKALDIAEETAKAISKHFDPSQAAKADCGKPQISLVPMEILNAIARVREYGNKKYKDKDNWKTVEPQRYVDATLRHMIAFAEDPKSTDQESGLPHLWHIACNVAFLIKMLG